MTANPMIAPSAPPTMALAGVVDIGGCVRYPGCGDVCDEVEEGAAELVEEMVGDEPAVRWRQ